MNAPEFRILVVDDCEPMRRQICSLVKTQADLCVVAEVADGVEAVQRAQELQPDLILLDIGLPTLNGLEAAQLIRQVAPGAKIIFVTQNNHPDVVRAALATEASGYVLKTDAGRELLAAVDAVRQGKQYLGSRLSTRTDAIDAEAPKQPLMQTPRVCDHAVQFHLDDESLLTGFTAFIEAALKDGSAVIALMTTSHLESLLHRLQAKGLNIAAAVVEGRYIPLDVADTLATFMVNDLPDPVRFNKVTEDLVVAAAKAAEGDRPRVVACGEVAPYLWAGGKADAAIQLEHLWDEMAKKRELDTLCGYVLQSGQREQEGDMYDRICAEHSRVSSGRGSSTPF